MMRPQSTLGTKLAALTLVPMTPRALPVIVPRGTFEARDHGWPSQWRAGKGVAYDRGDGKMYDAEGKVVGTKNEKGEVEWAG